jgi:hypothetical protein
MFDFAKFETTKWENPTEDIEIKELAPFFQDGAKPVLTVRALTGPEWGACQEMADNAERLIETAMKSLSGSPADVSEYLQKLYGHSQKNSKDTVMRLEIFKKALVAPNLQPNQMRQFAISLNKYLPFDFLHVTNKIRLLTGAGHVPGKPQPSSQDQK